MEKDLRNIIQEYLNVIEPYLKCDVWCDETSRNKIEAGAYKLEADVLSYVINKIKP